MYSKPLATRMEGTRDASSTIRRPITGAVNFAAFLPQNGVQTPGASAQTPVPGTGQNTGQTPIEQGATQNNLGLNQMRALAALTAAKTSETAQKKTEDGQSLGLPLHPRDIYKLLTRSAPDAESAETAIRAKAHRKSAGKDKAKNASKEQKAEEAATTVSATLDVLRQKTAEITGQAAENAAEPMGKLAARFESGSEGIAAIGYDRHGGTSYGKFQISSRAGTMRRFVEYLQTEAPDLAEKLQKAGPMNTGGKRGKMPEVWKQIAEETPDRFEDLQDKFIRASHFEPAMRAIAQNTGMDMDNMPAAFQEVILSTAVQHGPNGASRIISRALNQVGQTRLDPDRNEPTSLAKAQENVIRRVYANRSGQFQSSTETVQTAVKNRLKQEMTMAISMLRGERTA